MEQKQVHSTNHMKNDPIEMHKALQNNVRRMMDGNPDLITEEEVLSCTIDELIDDISPSDVSSDEIRHITRSELKNALFNMFTVGRSFPFFRY